MVYQAPTYLVGHYVLAEGGRGIRSLISSYMEFYTPVEIFVEHSVEGLSMGTLGASSIPPMGGHVEVENQGIGLPLINRLLDIRQAIHNKVESA